MMVWGLVSFVLGLIVLGLFVLAVAYAVKWVRGQKSGSEAGAGESVLDILKKRYARGEISKQEFEPMKKETE